jgi:hypothetical protein
MVPAIECDGASYHSSATARDRDRLRQDHLERLGWKFHRIWSQDWFYHREAEIARALAAYRAAVTTADHHDTIEPPAPPAQDKAAAEAAPARRTSSCPVATYRNSIDEYSPGELVAVVRWIESDTLLRTEEQLLAETIRTLGFTRKGSKIATALTAAIAQARDWPARR